MPISKLLGWLKSGGRPPELAEQAELLIDKLLAHEYPDRWQPDPLDTEAGRVLLAGEPRLQIAAALAALRRITTKKWERALLLGSLARLLLRRDLGLQDADLLAILEAARAAFAIGPARFLWRSWSVPSNAAVDRASHRRNCAPNWSGSRATSGRRTPPARCARSSRESKRFLAKRQSSPSMAASPGPMRLSWNSPRWTRPPRKHGRRSFITPVRARRRSLRGNGWIRRAR